MFARAACALRCFRYVKLTNHAARVGTTSTGTTAVSFFRDRKKGSD